MLTVSGLVFIPRSEEIVERKYKSGTSFTFVGVSKHPYKTERCYYRISLFTLDSQTDEVRSKLYARGAIQIRIGELHGNKFDNKILMSISTKANWVEFLDIIPRKS